jgi:hypothetical protein
LVGFSHPAVLNNNLDIHRMKYHEDKHNNSQSS